MYLAWAEGGVFTPLMSKGYRVDTCACPDAVFMVLSSLIQLSGNRAQSTQSSGKQLGQTSFCLGSVPFGGHATLLYRQLKQPWLVKAG